MTVPEGHTHCFSAPRVFHYSLILITFPFQVDIAFPCDEIFSMHNRLYHPLPPSKNLSEIGEGALPASPWAPQVLGAANSSQGLAGLQAGSCPSLLLICKSDLPSTLPGSYFTISAMPQRHGTLWMWSACGGCAKVYERESDVWCFFTIPTSS